MTKWYRNLALEIFRLQLKIWTPLFTLLLRLGIDYLYFASYNT